MLFEPLFQHAKDEPEHLAVIDAIAGAYRAGLELKGLAIAGAAVTTRATAAPRILNFMTRSFLRLTLRKMRSSHRDSGFVLGSRSNN